jgi:hypothetical protein
MRSLRVVPSKISRIPQRINTRRQQAMSELKILSAAAVLSLMIATPVFAQAAVQEPGAAAFYHPNADILHTGRPRPAEAAGAWRRYRSAVAAHMPPWAAMRVRLLAGSVTVPTIRHRARSLAMMASATRADEQGPTSATSYHVSSNNAFSARYLAPSLPWYRPDPALWLEGFV